MVRLYYKVSFFEWRVANKLKVARAKFWTNIDAVTNEVKICISDAKRDAEEIQRDWELTAMDLD